MASELHKYTSQEALNAALNSDRDALKVAIENATISAGDLEVNNTDLETKVDATNTKLDAIIVDLAALEVLVTAIKDKTDDITFAQGSGAGTAIEVKTY